MNTIVSANISMAGQRVTSAVIAGDIVNNPSKLKHSEARDFADQIQDMFSGITSTSPKCSKRITSLSNCSKDIGLGLGS